jgi:hypothetical protein
MMPVARSSTCPWCRCEVRAVRDDLDRPLSPAAQAQYLSIMRHTAVADMKADAAELTELYAALNEPERAKLLALLFGSEAQDRMHQ